MVMYYERGTPPCTYTVERADRTLLSEPPSAIAGFASALLLAQLYCYRSIVIAPLLSLYCYRSIHLASGAGLCLINCFLAPLEIAYSSHSTLPVELCDRGDIVSKFRFKFKFKFRAHDRGAWQCKNAHATALLV